MCIIREVAGCNFGKDHTKGENVGREVEFVAEEDLWRHVCVCTAKGEATRLFLVAGGNAGKSKVCDLKATVRGDEKVLAFEVAVDAFTCMKVGERTRNIGCK